MSKLLVNEYPIVVLPKLAEKIGLNEAIVLQQVHYWLEKTGVGIEADGFHWVHNTYAEWQKNFPFWSETTVKRVIQSLEDSGLLVSAKTSKNPFDHTKSYRIDYEKLQEFEEQSGQDELADGVNLTRTFTETTISETTNTTPSVESRPLPNIPLSIENQIYVGVEKVQAVENRQMQMIDTADFIATGMGKLSEYARDIALTFMQTRDIIIPKSGYNKERKAVKELAEMGVFPNHIEEATRQLMNNPKLAGIVSLHSVKNVAFGLANTAEEGYTGAIENV